MCGTRPSRIDPAQAATLLTTTDGGVRHMHNKANGATVNRTFLHILHVYIAPFAFGDCRRNGSRACPRATRRQRVRESVRRTRRFWTIDGAVQGTTTTAAGSIPSLMTVTSGELLAALLALDRIGSGHAEGVNRLRAGEGEFLEVSVGISTSDDRRWEGRHFASLVRVWIVVSRSRRFHRAPPRLNLQATMSHQMTIHVFPLVDFLPQMILVIIGQIFGAQPSGCDAERCRWGFVESGPKWVFRQLRRQFVQIPRLPTHFSSFCVVNKCRLAQDQCNIRVKSVCK